MPPVKGKMLAYPEEAMRKAIEDVSNGMAVATAAKLNQVPRVTLLYKIKGISPKERRMGPSSILNKDEEKLLVKWVINVGEAGFPVTKCELLDSVQHLVKELNRVTPFTDGRPGRKWYESFLKRNPSISIRVAENLTSSRANVTPESIKNWFSEINEYLIRNNFKEILDHPERVFNADESAFFLNPQIGSVLVKKGSKNVYQKVNSNEKECLTVLFCGNADGALAPPLIVFSYERIPQDIALSIPVHWGIGKSESGWMTGELFYEYITNVFNRWLTSKNIKRPVILFIDGHKSHLTLHTSKFCEDNGIILVSLFPNATHVIQPMDVAVFRVLKEGWRTGVHKWRIDNSHRPMFKKRDFAPLLETVIASKIHCEILQNGFRKCGLVPWDPEAVDYSRVGLGLDKNTSVYTSSQDNSENNPSNDVNENISGLKFLENEIPVDKLAKFKDSEVPWNGDPTDLSLFMLWKKISDRVLQHQKLPLVEKESAFQPTIENINLELSQPGTLSPEQLKLNLIMNPISDSLPSCSKITTPQRDSVSLQNSNSTPVPSPFKRALFWPESKPTEKKKKKEKIPSVVTSKEWQNYYENKEKKKLEEELKKKLRAEARKKKKEEKEELKQIKERERRKLKEKKLNSKKRKIELTDSEDDEEWQESGCSTDDVDLLEESDYSNNGDSIKVYNMSDKRQNVSDNNFTEGDFILVEFPGKKKSHRYACILREKLESDEAVVIGLKCISDDKRTFKINESDESIIEMNQIFKKLSFPTLVGSEERQKYIFNESLNVDG